MYSWFVDETCEQGWHGVSNNPESGDSITLQNNRKIRTGNIVNTTTGQARIDINLRLNSVSLEDPSSGSTEECFGINDAHLFFPSDGGFESPVGFI